MTNDDTRVSLYQVSYRLVRTETQQLVIATSDREAFRAALESAAREEGEFDLQRLRPYTITVHTVEEASGDDAPSLGWSLIR